MSFDTAFGFPAFHRLSPLNRKLFHAFLSSITIIRIPTTPSAVPAVGGQFASASCGRFRITTRSVSASAGPWFVYRLWLLTIVSQPVFGTLTSTEVPFDLAQVARRG